MSQECDSKTKLELAFDSENPAYNDVMLNREKKCTNSWKLDYSLTAH